MALVPLLLALAAALLAWAGQGFPLDPRWALAALPLALWTGAALRRARVLLQLGFLSLVALACVSALAGALATGLGALALALMAWDSADLLHWQGEKRELGRVASRGLGRSALVAGIGWGLGWASSRLRLTLPFWGLLGLLVLVWLALWAWSRAVQGRGGEAKGNRSESGPM